MALFDMGMIEAIDESIEISTSFFAIGQSMPRRCKRRYTPALLGEYGLREQRVDLFACTLYIVPQHEHIIIARWAAILHRLVSGRSLTWIHYRLRFSRALR